MKKGNFKNSRRFLFLFSLLLLIVASIIVTRSFVKFSEFDKIQKEAIENLTKFEGEYNEKSIVLENTSFEEANKIAKKLNATLRTNKDGTFATLTLSDDVTTQDVFKNKANKEIIKDLSLDFFVKTSDVDDEEETIIKPSKPKYSGSKDPYYSYQTYLDYIHMENVWNNYTGNSLTLAIIDTGIDTDHPEFRGRISEYSYNATEDKIVKDYILDSGEYDWSLIEDEQGHGTSVAGVAAASFNGSGIMGIAPNVNLLIIKAECDERGNFLRGSDLVFGLYYAIERDVDVVNMSFGGSSNSYSAPLRLAVDSDIICVAAAGNEATASLTYPAADPNAIGVGALASDSFTLANYSNFGENSDIVAPGTVYTCAIGGGYKTIDGTSFASPIVASAIILMKGSSNDRYKEYQEIQELLFASSLDLGSLGNDFYYGYGALDISALILESRGKVTFDMLTDELEDIEQTFIRNHTLQNLPEPQRLYSVFDGWYYDIHCTEEVNYYQDIWTTDLTLYAKWANEDDAVPYTYVILDDGTVEIRSYTGKRRYITIPDEIEGRTVTSIGDFCFTGNQRLREVNLPKGLKNIGLEAFRNCSNLLSIHIPSEVEKIGAYTFDNSSRLYEVSFDTNSKIKYIGDYAFSNTSIERFEVKKQVNRLNGSAFYGCRNLLNFTVEKGNASFKTIDGVLYNKTESEIVAYPASKPLDAYSLKDITKTIGVCAFAFSKIKTINLNKVVTIGDSAFAYSRLDEVRIPDTTKTLGKLAFYFAEYLKSVSLGKNIKNVQPGTFASTSSLKTINIPNNIEKIEDGGMLPGAFESSSLESVTFEKNSRLFYIGGSAFSFCPISTITIPRSVVTIGAYAFSYYPFYNPYLTSVLFEENSSLKTIGADAFSGCVSLSSITFPESLNYIGFKSFASSGLTGNVLIPKNVSVLGEAAFSGCENLENIKIDKENEVYKDVDGVVYKKDGTIITHFPSGKNITSYTVLDNTLEVGNYAFSTSNKLIYVSFPNTLHTIGEYAYEYCEKVINYSLPESLIYIKRYAFTYNTSLRNISIPDNVMQISNYAFSYCNNLTKINFNETSKLPRISFASFAYSGITSIRIPKNVSTIAQSAFEGCNNLTSVVFASGSKIDLIPAYMFKGANNIRSITFENGSSLTSISAHGFEGMSRLSSIDFGNASLTNIDNFAFRYCESLSSITIPEGVDYIGRFAFYGCKSLTELTLPSTIERIGRNAFYHAENLNVYFKANTLPLSLEENWDLGIRGYYIGVTNVETLGDYKYATLTNGGTSIIEYLGNDANIDLTNISISDIRQIGGYAFYNKKITSITLPSTLKEIHRYAFSYTDLNSITIPRSVEMIARNAFEASNIASVTFEENINLAKIEQYAFAYTSYLTSIKIPKSIKELGSYTFLESGIQSVIFEDGINLEKIPSNLFLASSLTNVVIPNSVNYIDDNAFRDCLNLQSVTLSTAQNLQIHANAFYNTGLTSVKIGSNVEYIGEYAFIGLKNLLNYEVDENNPNYKEIDGVLYSKNGKKLIAFPAKRTGEFVVPKEVETIGFGAFENSNLNKVTFEEGINLLTLGYRAFYNAKNLKEITVPKTVVSIDYYAFGECRNLETVTFEEGNKLTGVYEGAFINCVNLTNIVLPDTIKEISDYAFYGCVSLKTLPVSESHDLKGIYSYAFAYSGIKELNLPKSLVDIGEYAFMGIKIKTLEIPKDEQKHLIIGIGAFRDCNELEEITMPFIGASFDEPRLNWFGYIFGAGSYQANSTYIPESLKVVNINGDITRIENYSFDGIDNVRAVFIPKTVVKVGYNYFSSNNLVLFRSETLPEGLTTRSNYYLNVKDYVKNDIYEYIAFNDNTALILNYIGNKEHVDFSKVDGYKIINTSLGEMFRDHTELKSIIIGSEVTSIGNSAFSGFRSLESVTFGENSQLTSIGDAEFYGCGSLASIEIPSGVTSIGSSAFFGCGSLASIEIPSGVTSIGESAFYGCRSLTSVTFGENSKLTNIGSSAFSGCESLTSIEIPSRVNSIESHTFYGCKALKTVTFEQISELKTVGIFSFSYCESLSYIKFPSSVNSIGECAFQDCTSLTSITFAENSQLTSIENWAFSGCSTLTNVAFGENSKLTSIGNSAFYGCSSLTSIIIPSGVTSIGDSAFEGCSNLLLVYNNSDLNLNLESNSYGCITSYAKMLIDKNVIHTKEDGNSYYLTDDNFMFEYSNNTYKLIGYLGNEDIVRLPDDYNGNKYSLYCVKGLKNVIIPSSFEIIHNSAFDNSNTLKTVTFEENSQLTSIGIWAFNGCESLTSIEIPSGVTSIGSGAFNGCESLTSIEIPSGVTSIESYAFSGCESLTSIEIPSGVTSIGGNAFYGCESLTSIEIPSGVTSIGGYAFYGCESLTSIEIPSGVTSIASNTFSNCPLLKLTIDSNNNYFAEINNVIYNKEKTQIIFVPDSVKNLIVPNTVTDLNLAGNTNIETIEFEENSKLKNIGYSAFSGCSSLTSIEIPSGVTSIEISAFSDCSSLESVTFGENSQLTSIGYSAFSGCSSLISINIPSGVTSIGSSAFDGCESLTSINIPSGVTSIGEWAFDGCSSLESITFGENSQLTSIGDYAFSGCESLTSIEIPSGVTSIGNEAFRDCRSLTSITIPSGVTSIGGGAFYGCSSLTSINIPSGVTSIGSSAFSGCESLTSITIPSGVTSIGGGAFYGCSSLTSINIPSGVTSIGSSAFSGCESLTSIKIPSGVTSIGWSAFSGCESLTSIEIPSGVTSIGSEAFWGCESLTSITIPSGVTSIGDSAFIYCSSLTSVTFEKNSNLTSIGAEAFSACSSLISIEIPSKVISIGENTFLDCYDLWFVRNNSNLNIEIGSNLFGGVAYYAKILIDKNGTSFFNDGNEYFLTEDKFLFEYSNDTYKLTGYLGTEDTVRLPDDYNGNKYSLYCVTGLKNVIIPSSFETISDNAFSNSKSLKTVTIEENSKLTSIGGSAFYGCSSLISIEIPSGVTSIGGYAFYGCSSLSSIIFNGNLDYIGNHVFTDTAFFNDEHNWENGCLYFNDYLADVKTDLKELKIRENTKLLASDVLYNCYSLEYVNSPYFSDLFNLSNVKTIRLSSLLSNYLSSNKPLTLKNVILSKNCDVRSSYLFNNITDVNIYVENPKIAVMWDHDYPGWNNGNKVYYAGEWIEAVFRDVNGEVISRDYYTTNQIIRQPYVKDITNGIKKYIFQGWDIDSDGITDSIPATSAISFDAKAVMKEVDNDFKVTYYDYFKNVYLEEIYLNESILTLPTPPTKKGYIFLGWSGYTENMQVTSNIELYSLWKHEGEGHSYNMNHINPTCANLGYDEFVCSICDHTYRENILEKLPHTYSEWVVDANPTCEEDGLRHRVCTICTYEESETIYSEGHNYEMTHQADSTCTKHGHRHYECSNCHNRIEEEIPLAPHEYEKKYASITWIEWLIRTLLNVFFGYEGNMAFYYCCVNCHDIMTFEQATSSIQFVGIQGNDTCEHILGDYVVQQEPSCIDGYKVRYCSKCQKVVEAQIIDATGVHTFGEPTYEWLGNNTKVKATRVCQNDSSHIETETVNVTSQVVQEQSCTNKELTTYTSLSFTNEAFTVQIKENVETKDALGHTYSSPTYEWIDNNTKVKATRVCQNDSSHIETETVSVTSQIVQEQSCTNKELTTYTSATFTNESFTVQVKANVETKDALSHSYSAPTYEWLDNNTKVKATRVCKNAPSHIETETVSVTSQVVQEQSCTNKELTTYTSKSFTNESFTVQVKANVETKDALGHNFIWIIDVNPTEDSVGKKHEECTICHTTRNENTEIPKTDHVHNLVYVKEVKPTCENVGIVEHYHCTKCMKNYSDKTGLVELSSVTVIKLGHSYSAPTYEWFDNNTKVKATRVCANDPSHIETETVNVTSQVVQEQSCTNKELTTYTSLSFTNEAFTVQVKANVETKDALGHNFIWIIDVNPTEDNVGKKHEECTICHTTRNENTEIPKTDHVHNLVYVEEVKPTCEDEGNVEHYHCTKCMKNYSDKTGLVELSNVTVIKLGHSYTAPTYEWLENNTKVKATRVCENDSSHIEAETVNVTSQVVQVQSCENKELTTYTSLSFTNEAFTVQVKENVETKDVLGHNYGKPVWVWSDDYSEAFVIFTCINCNREAKVSAEVTQEEVIKADEFKEGKIKFTGTISFDGKTFDDVKEKTIEKLIPVKPVKKGCFKKNTPSLILSMISVFSASIIILRRNKNR